MQKKSQNFFHHIIQKQYRGLLLVSLLALYLSVSCRIQPYIIMPAYKEFIAGKSLMITPLQSSNIQISDAVEKAFGKRATDSLYISFFEENFSNTLGRISSFTKVTRSPDKPAGLKAMEVIVPRNDTTYFYLPGENKILFSKYAEKADFILFLTEFELTPSWIDIEYGQNPDIRHTIYYLFWDNQRHKIVCYGKTRHTNAVSKNDKQSFQLLINNLAKSLIENTPFRKILNQW